LRVPVDLLVVDEEAYEYWSEVPGNVYYEAHKKEQPCMKQREQAILFIKKACQDEASLPKLYPPKPRIEVQPPEMPEWVERGEQEALAEASREPMLDYLFFYGH
jgi:hypothetical protein